MGYQVLWPHKLL